MCVTLKQYIKVPIAKELIDKNLMTAEEIEWLNNYHSKVYKTLSPHMKESHEIEYLKNATSPL